MEDQLKLFTAAEIAQFLGISVYTIRRLVESGKLQAIYVGNGTIKRTGQRFTQESLTAYLNGRAA